MVAPSTHQAYFVLHPRSADKDFPDGAHALCVRCEQHMRGLFFCSYVLCAS